MKHTPDFFKPFGPVIYSNLVDNKVFNVIQHARIESENKNINVGKKLAGFIENQLKLVMTEDEKKTITNEIFEHVSCYLNISIEEAMNRFYIPNSSYWINIQKPKEFNPAHHHNGSISGVIYLDVPLEIFEEKFNIENNKTTFNNFGEIAFYYGDGELSERYFYITPRTQQILLFPASLEHGVFPFYSNVLRVSVAFNLYENKAYCLDY